MLLSLLSACQPTIKNERMKWVHLNGIHYKWCNHWMILGVYTHLCACNGLSTCHSHFCIHSCNTAIIYISKEKVVCWQSLLHSTTILHVWWASVCMLIVVPCFAAHGCSLVSTLLPLQFLYTSFQSNVTLAVHLGVYIPNFIKPTPHCHQSMLKCMWQPLPFFIPSVINI